MFRFEKLEIWELAISYGKECYSMENAFPVHERYALGDQLRRASVSISNNIAEGSIGSRVNFKRYINMAIGSALETVNILHFSHEMGYISKKAKEEMYEEAEKLIRKLSSFSNSLND